jgi:HEAT repeat protein
MLATVNKSTDFMLIKFRPDYLNLASKCCRAELLSIAEDRRNIYMRAFAIRTLGRSRLNDQDSELIAPLRQWTVDPVPSVRAAAAYLWTDYPSAEATAVLREMSSDKSPEVRRSVAYSIGISQNSELKDVLERLWSDKTLSLSREVPFRREDGTPVPTF